MINRILITGKDTVLNFYKLHFLPLVSFPANSPSFQNPLESKHKICFDFKNKRGCYLWTHKQSSKQYIGSSRNLSFRLSEYYRVKYLELQSNRGSAICRAILKHGLDQFSLSIMVLGDTLEHNTNYSSDNLPDFVVMEQSYLDKYTLDYNVNRVASSKYESSEVSVNLGEDNPSYNLKREQAFAWDKIHSEELKIRWSSSRGKHVLFIYSAQTFEFIQSFPSAVKLSSFLKVSLAFGLQIVKLIQTSEYNAIVYEDYIISLMRHDALFLSTNSKLFPVKSVATKKITRNITIYGYNPSINEYRSWSSKADCIEYLTGQRFTNIRTINKRIDKGILYKGFYLQTKPFK